MLAKTKPHLQSMSCRHIKIRGMADFGKLHTIGMRDNNETIGNYRSTASTSHEHAFSSILPGQNEAYSPSLADGDFAS